MQLVFLDTETTGLDEKDRLLQLAYMCDDESVNELFNPGVPIHFKALETHGKTPEMLADKPPFKSSEIWTKLKNKLENEDSVMICHNLKFDHGMLLKEEINAKNHICTLKLSRYLNPELSKHNLQVLREHYKIDVEAQAHDAFGDIVVLKEVFTKLFNQAQQKMLAKSKVTNKTFTDADVIKRMIEITMSPALITKLPFGKYSGYKITDVAYADPAYLKWLLKEKSKETTKETDLITAIENALAGQSK